MNKRVLAMIVGLFMMMSFSHAASFDCNQAKLATEKQICAVRSLNDADVRMVTVYDIVLHAVTMGSRDAEKNLQYQWLKQRNRCGANVQCIATAYQTRQAHLDRIVQDRVLSQGPF